MSKREELADLLFHLPNSVSGPEYRRDIARAIAAVLIPDSPPESEPKPEPAKADWLEVGLSTYAMGWLSAWNRLDRVGTASEQYEALKTAIRANYISKREKRYRAALEAIVSRGSVSARTIDVAREVLKDKP